MTAYEDLRPCMEHRDEWETRKSKQMRQESRGNKNTNSNGCGGGTRRSDFGFLSGLEHGGLGLEVVDGTVDVDGVRHAHLELAHRHVSKT